MHIRLQRIFAGALALLMGLALFTACGKQNAGEPAPQSHAALALTDFAAWQDGAIVEAAGHGTYGIFATAGRQTSRGVGIGSGAEVFVQAYGELLCDFGSPVEGRGYDFDECVLLAEMWQAAGRPDTFTAFFYLWTELEPAKGTAPHWATYENLAELPGGHYTYFTTPPGYEMAQLSVYVEAGTVTDLQAYLPS